MRVNAALGGTQARYRRARVNAAFVPLPAPTVLQSPSFVLGRRTGRCLEGLSENLVRRRKNAAVGFIVLSNYHF